MMLSTTWCCIGMVINASSILRLLSKPSSTPHSHGHSKSVIVLFGDRRARILVLTLAEPPSREFAESIIATNSHFHTQALNRTGTTMTLDTANSIAKINQHTYLFHLFLSQWTLDDDLLCHFQCFSHIDFFGSRPWKQCFYWGRCEFNKWKFSMIQWCLFVSVSSWLHRVLNRTIPPMWIKFFIE